jgi:heme oxygenase (biliverdin-IX-beta and delta-forming)
MQTSKPINTKSTGLDNDNCPMTALRLRTAAAHRAVEKTFLISKLISQDLTHNNYIDILCGWQQWLVCNEHTICNQLGNLAPSDIAQRNKLVLVEKDLAQLEVSAARPVSYELIPLNLDNAYEAIGALYVLEGATLGGQIILKRLQSQLEPKLSHYFYSAYQANTQHMWSVFGQ